MLTVYRFEDLGKADYGWLKPNYHFSFAGYYNPNKVNLGPLRVMNNDYISPYNGFSTHPHNDMEIITYIVSGKLTHQDSMGNKRVLGPGGVQYMSAGTGVTHSEHNNHSEVLHLYQIWIHPREKGLKPNYGDITFDDGQKQNKLLKIVSNHEGDGEIKIYQDATIEVGLFDQNKTLNLELGIFDNFYLVLIEGELEINGNILSSGDAIEGNEDSVVNFTKNAHVLLIKV